MYSSSCSSSSSSSYDSTSSMCTSDVSPSLEKIASITSCTDSSVSVWFIMSSISFMFISSSSSDSPSFTRYSVSASLSVKWISSPSFLTMIPSSSPIALNTFRISSSDASVKSIGLSSSESMSMSVSTSISTSSVSSSTSISTSISTSSVSTSASTSVSKSTSSCSERDSFTNWLISSFIVEWSIPFAFSAIASSTFFIWISASCTNDLFSCMKNYLI